MVEYLEMKSVESMAVELVEWKAVQWTEKMVDKWAVHWVEHLDY
jgi:hypothetical protein